MADPLRGLVEGLAASPAVTAVAMVGSHMSGVAESTSDVDIFVYTDGNVGELRSRIAEQFADPAEWRSVHETAFGDGDVWRLREDGNWIDLMYWTTAWAEAQLRRVLVDCAAALGYSTAFWRSIRNARPLYERDAWHRRLQRQATHPYPEALRQNIISLNHPWLRDHPLSYRQQVAWAIERNDVVNVNHRVAAWLASYFDILFAVNRVLHPGEKRLLEFLVRECPLLPAGVPGAIEDLVSLAGRATPEVLEAMDDLTKPLDLLLCRQRLLRADLHSGPANGGRAATPENSLAARPR